MQDVGKLCCPAGVLNNEKLMVEKKRRAIIV